MTHHKVFCTAPWTGLTIRENGFVKTCCVGEVNLGNLNYQSMDDILNSPSLKEIQKKMSNGEPDLQNCKHCISEQKQAGFAALQQHYNQYYPEFNPNQIELKNLDLRWNNVCNLGCMYCGPDFSSVWENRLEIKRGTAVKDYQDDLLAWILKHSTEIQELMLVGGEPMLMKQNYSLLNQLPDECRVSIITNLSYNITTLPCISNLLRRPKENTVWNVSLENTGFQFEYVRNGGSWEQVKNNLEYLNQNWPGFVNVNFVYSMFSAFDILETIKTLHELGIKKINFVTINQRPTIDVFNMPDPIRQEAARQLNLAQQWHMKNIHPEDRNLYPLEGADSIFNQLMKPNTTPSVTKENFLTKIQWYDQYNTQKFQDLWPNVIDLVARYL